MGVLNVTPDSFSDGGLHKDGVRAGHLLLEEGADILDIGGESTRPGAAPVDPAEEQRRVLPVVAALARHGARISVDTRNAATMRAALDLGAWMINDVSALSHDPASLPLIAQRDCPVVLMHMRGTPATMMGRAQYDDVAGEVVAELGQAVARAEAAGVRRARIVLDPGLGFAKTPDQSLAVLLAMERLAGLGLPLLIGASRKGFVGVYGGEPDPARRMPGSVAVALFAAMNGASILRVHDVAATVQALRVWRALGMWEGKNVLF